MPRRIHEDDLLAFITDLIGADVLCNAAGFVAGNAALTDRIEEARLTVVDVTHNGNYRRSCFQRFRRIYNFFNFRRIFRGCFLRDGYAEFISNDRGRFIIDFLVDRCHKTIHKELLNDFADFTA